MPGIQCLSSVLSLLLQRLIRFSPRRWISSLSGPGRSWSCRWGRSLRSAFRWARPPGTRSGCRRSGRPSGWSVGSGGTPRNGCPPEGSHEQDINLKVGLLIGGGTERKPFSFCHCPTYLLLLHSDILQNFIGNAKKALSYLQFYANMCSYVSSFIKT